MNVKKLLAVLCTLALVFTLAVPAFASSAVENGTENTFVGTDTEDDSELTVSISVLKGANRLYVNPYGLPYTIREGTAEGPTANGEKIKEGTTTAGWFSTTSVIKNESTTELKVSVTMKSEERSANVKVVEDEDSVNPAFNCLYGNLEIASATMSAAKLITPDWDGEETPVVTVPVPTAANPITTPRPTTFVLDAADNSRTDDAGDPIIDPGFAAFRIRGSAKLGAGSATNSDASDGSVAEWAKTDLVDVTVAFSFEPYTTP